MFRKMFVAVIGLVFLGVFEISGQTKPTFVPSHRIAGVGKDREKLTTADVKYRTELAVYAQRFWIMKQPEARDAPRRIFEGPLWKIIQSAARAQNLDPLILAARIFLESWGICTARASKKISAAAGCAQFTDKGAVDEGLVIKTERRRVSKTITVGKGKQARKKTVVVTEIVVVRDDRLDPELSINAMARRIKRQSQLYGDASLEVAEYHMGYGNMLKTLSLYTGVRLDPKTPIEEVRRLVQSRGLTYPLVFFGNSPRYKPALYAHLKGLADYSKTYFFRVQAAHDLIKIYQKNPEDYAKIWEQYKPKFPGRTRLPNRMWSYYGPEDVERLSIPYLIRPKDEKRKSLIEEWASKRIVSLPNLPEVFGIKIRTTGDSPIAQYDPANRPRYMGSEPATLGALLYIAYELKRIECRKFEDKEELRPIECPDFRALETNSLVRHLIYQDKLGADNILGKTLLPTHTMGKAGDLPRKSMPAPQQVDLSFLLDDMESLGLLSWIREGAAGQMAYHVVPDPSYADFFKSVYDDARAFLVRSGG